MAKGQEQAQERQRRLDRAGPFAAGKAVTAANAKALLEAVVRPGDRVCLEGDNQKQVDFLAEALASVDRSMVHDAWPRRTSPLAVSDRPRISAPWMGCGDG